jgi:tetratricopeptide (TPR) repeat protein
LQAVLTFLDEHKDPAVQQFLLNRIAGKYAGRTDYENMPSLFVYSIALKKLEKADALWRAKETDQARELYDEVVKMMDLVQDRKDTPPGLQKDIGNLLGYIDNKLGRELEAARKFRQIARRDPSAEGAITAATNALKIYRKLVAERPTAQRKKEFIETLEFFLQARNGAWAKKEPQWHFDLAWQLESLGQTQAGQAQKQTYLRAVQAYEKVPKTTPEYMQARYRGLSLQMKIIDEFGQGNVQREQARKLIDSMQRFVSEAKSAIAETDDKGKVESMREWAARAQFESAILMSEVLGQDERALKLIDRLPEEWPGTRVLRWAAAFRIERLMKTDRVSEALAAFNEFRRKYGEEKARGLVQSLIREVRENIDELDRQGGDPARLRQYREVYVQFAKNLYVTSADESASRRYPLKQMYADALLEQGYSARAAKEDPEPFFKKALAFYQELYAFDQKRVKASRDKIEAEFKDKVTAVKSAGGNVRNMLSLGKQYIEDAAEDNYTSVSLTLLSDAVSELDDAVDEKDIQEAMAAVQFRMKKFLDDYRQWKLGRVPLDGANILGLARSHRLLGALDKANEFYRRWVRSAPSNHPQWWEVQYEYSETFYKISKDKPDDLKKLRMKIGQLQASDKSMGGERNRFALLLRLIKRSLDE